MVGATSSGGFLIFQVVKPDHDAWQQEWRRWRQDVRDASERISFGGVSRQRQNLFAWN